MVAVYVGMYILMAGITYIFLSGMLNLAINSEEEYDELAHDNGAKMMALLFASLLWFITVPIILFNNLFDKGEDKNGK